ncbi:hypothetical protein [Streptomyces sp. NTK 937]|uniref:hypothetical protein n=1 Tax=Streptomyces sp. NTK 937 TaxID=1487711 RepID=UPI0004A9A17F|nr:hypothetical protein [Streptomyces sp. NTK 937]KDQ65715.1 hypothetical protein DT87_00210 [Streptomyces sp. NTK 937]
MTMQIDGEDFEISPAVWEVFDAWYGDKAYRQAGFVAEIEAAVRAQVAKEIGDRLTYGSHSWIVEDEPRRVDYQENSILFEVWVKWGDDGESSEG